MGNLFGTHFDWSLRPVIGIELEHAVKLLIASENYHLATLRDMFCVVVHRRFRPSLSK
jgi:hypothetical protein